MVWALVAASSCRGGGAELPPTSTVTATLAANYARHEAPALHERTEPHDTLKVRREFGDSLSFARVVKIYHRDGHLLALDQLLSYHLATIDLSDGSTKHFGRHGEGPGEFRVPFSASFVQDTDHAWVYDFELNRFSLLDLGGDEPKLLRTKAGPREIQLLDPVLSNGLISNTLSADASLLIAADGSDGGASRIVNLRSPFDAVDHPDPLARRLLSRTFLSPSPDGSRVALAYQFANQIEILTSAGVHLSTSSGPRDANPSYRFQAGRFFWNDDNVSLYGGITTSDRHIYVLYCGCRFSGEQTMWRIHIFDWEGAFIGEIAVDRPISSLTVARDDSRLWAFVEEPHPAIVEWSGPDILGSRRE